MSTFFDRMFHGFTLGLGFAMGLKLMATVLSL